MLTVCVVPEESLSQALLESIRPVSHFRRSYASLLSPSHNSPGSSLFLGPLFLPRIIRSLSGMLRSCLISIVSLQAFFSFDCPPFWEQHRCFTVRQAGPNRCPRLIRDLGYLSVFVRDCGLFYAFISLYSLSASSIVATFDEFAFHPPQVLPGPLILLS